MLEGLRGLRLVIHKIVFLALLTSLEKIRMIFSITLTLYLLNWTQSVSSLWLLEGKRKEKRWTDELHC